MPERPHERGNTSYSVLNSAIFEKNNIYNKIEVLKYSFWGAHYQKLTDLVEATV